MDRCTHEVRLQHWKNIISQCQARPSGQTAKQWLAENGICEQTYYLWQRRIRQETYELMTASAEMIPISQEKEEISFAEIPYKTSNTSSGIHSEDSGITPVAIIKTSACQIAVSDDIPEMLLARILREVAHA